MIFVVTTIEEGTVSFFQDSTASPAYLLEGYYICLQALRSFISVFNASAVRTFQVPMFN
jgi:hypothetical protein